MKRCPQCAEKVQSAAIRCRFCNAVLPKAAGLSNKAVFWGLGALVALMMVGKLVPSPKAESTMPAPLETPLPSKWRFASDDRAAVIAEVDRRIKLGTPESTAMALALLKDKFGEGPILFDSNLRPVRDRAKKANDDALAMANKPQIETLLRKEALLDRGDLAGRLAIWRKLSALAPGDEKYAQTAEELNAKIEAPRRAAAREEYYRDHPEAAISIANMRWHKGGFGSVMIADFTLENVSTLALRDFEIECEVRGNSGTVIGTERVTVFDTLGPQTTRTFRDVSVGFIHSQAQRAHCSTVGAKVS